jgi:hypothetical protein
VLLAGCGGDKVGGDCSRVKISTMNISIDSYRAVIGIWHNNSCAKNSKSPKVLLSPIKIKLLLAFILSANGVFIGALLLLRCGDVHPHPGPTFTNKSLSICHINIQSVYLISEKGHERRKINEIEMDLVNNMEIDIICLSETWLKPIIKDSDIDINGYSIKRKDRLVTRAGGVGMYINDSIYNRRALEYELPNLELMWVELNIGNKSVYLAVGYRPPRQNLEEVEIFMARFQESLDMVLRRNPESILVVGDFNDVCTEWNSDHRLSDLKLKLFDYINANDLHQMIQEPTFYTDTSANILDILITDSPGYLQKVTLLPPLGSDHEVIKLDFKIQYSRDTAYLREVWDFKKGNFENLVRDLKIVPWRVGQDLFEDIDDMANYWEKAFMDLCRVHIPNRIIKIRPKDKPWMNREVKNLIRRRNRSYKRFKRTRQQAHYENWKANARETNYYMHQAKLAHTTKIKQQLMDLKVGEKKYWSIAKQVYGSKKTIGIPALMVRNKPITTSSSKAECFNEYFAAQQTLPPIPFNQQMPPIIFITDSRLNKIETSEEEVIKVIKSLDIGKATGPDGISNRLLKETATAISLPLSDLFNKSFELGKIPKKWKEANLSPIFKKDDKAVMANYRPISLLSCLGKVQERIAYLHLYKYLQINKLLTWKNSGFRELDSAMNQLIYITHKIHRALEDGQEVCLVFLDVSKAFDRVWHSGLLHKSRCMGIDGNLFDWMCNYLQDRKIRVVINGQKSDWLNTTAGVPQGSILGPLLFLIFINDVTENIESDIHLFADDTSLMEILNNYNESYARLNRDLDRLALWADRWLITFNAAKTVYLKVSRKIHQAPKPVLKLGGVTIKEVQTHKHLGLTFNETLTWNDHIEKLAIKAAQCVGLLKRISRDVPRECLETLYKSMVRPLLEYGSVIYDGSAECHLQRLENVQRQAALTCTGAYKHTKHENLLNELGWPPLSNRRKQQRLNTMFKIQKGLAPPYLTDMCPPLTKDRTPYNLRSGCNITTPQSKTTVFQKSFFPQSIDDWNKLDAGIRSAKTIETFKENNKKKCKFKVNRLYHQYPSKAVTNHTRMRLGLSGLAFQRFEYNHIDNPKCPLCPAQREDLVHFFMTCPAHAAHREKFMTETCQILHSIDNLEVEFRSKRFRNKFIDIILKGTPLLSENDNKRIFEITQEFIQNSQRFT